MSKKRTGPSAKRPRDLVADTLRERIRSGEFTPGTRLPTQRELEAEFGVGRSAVREALGALIQEGLLDSVGRGASPTVAGPAESAEGPRTAGDLLTERLHEAFQADHVTLDAFSLTTETLNNALALPLRQIPRRERKPRSLTVRVLVPSPDVRLALPRLRADGEADDPRPLQRLQGIQRAYVQALTFSLHSLREYGIPEVDLQVRGVPLTPTHKLYLLNGTEALHGYYTVVVNEDVLIDGERMPIYDVLGLNSRLYFSSAAPPHHGEGGPAFVADSQRFFDSLWGTIAEEFPLD